MNYDLEFFMEKAEVIEVSEDGAKVYYILITRSVKGQGFLNKRDEGIHHLKKQDGKWKIFQTENISTKPIQ
jgi:DNA-binding transcriptional regulator PaaX